MTSDTGICVTANSSAAETPWRLLSFSNGGTRLATLRTTKISPGRYVEDLRGIDTAVGAGNDHRGRALSLRQFGPARALRRPTLGAEAAVAVEQDIEVRHGQLPTGVRQGWQVRRSIAISPAMTDAAAEARPPRVRKPDWIRVKAPTSAGFAETKALMRRLNLATVCEEAACPNIGECWTKKHATVMILGDTCTRACAFCNVKTGMPRAVDPFEPQHIGRRRRRAWPRAYRHHLGRSRRPARRRRFAVREGDRGAAPHHAQHDDRDPDARFPQQGAKPRSKRSSRRGPTSTTTISRPCRGSIRRSARARAIMPRCACWRA